MIEHHGGETLCDEIDGDTVGSKLLQNELNEIGDTELGDVPANIEEVYQDVDELIEEHGGEVLCGDFEIS